MKTDMEQATLMDTGLFFDIELSEDVYLGQAIDATGKAAQARTDNIVGIAEFAEDSGNKVTVAGTGNIANVYLNSSPASEGEPLMVDTNDSGSLVPFVVSQAQDEQTSIAGIAREDISAGSVGEAYIMPQLIQNRS